MRNKNKRIDINGRETHSHTHTHTHSHMQTSRHTFSVDNDDNDCGKTKFKSYSETLANIVMNSNCIPTGNTEHTHTQIHACIQGRHFLLHLYFTRHTVNSRVYCSFLAAIEYMRFLVFITITHTPQKQMCNN